MANNIEAIFNEFERNAKYATKKAINNVSKKIQKDLLLQARKNILAYYAQYNPDFYERTDNLKTGVVHYGFINDLSNNNIFSYEVGFKYDNSGMSEYNTGTFSAAMVFENFLAGEHPPVASGKSQNEMMEEYVDKNLENKINAYMQSELIAALSKLM